MTHSLLLIITIYVVISISLRSFSFDLTHMNDHSVFYYTYSTIAQTMAGGFGFLAAVVVFQMQTLQNRIDKYTRDWLIAQQSQDSARIRGFSNMRIACSKELENLKEPFKYSLKVTGGTIISCFVFLPLTPLLGGSYLAWLCLAATVTTAIYSITTFYPMVKGLFPVGLQFDATQEGQG